MSKEKTILVCPLDWGLGHATRDSYLIKRLLEKNFTVKIAGDGPSIEFLRSEFPDIEFIKLPSLQINYSTNLPAWVKITLLIPKIFWGFSKEHRMLKDIIRFHNIDLVISDTRYGLWNRRIKSIFICHQTKFYLPKVFKIFQYPVYRINRFLITRFHTCWIPDFPDANNLSGDLSHRYQLPGNASFVGILSRFTDLAEPLPETDTYDLAVLVSGPEPQRSIFEKILTDQTIQSNKKSIILTGQPVRNKINQLTDNCIKVSHLSTQQLAKILLTAKYIICRSGYSSVMDLVTLKRKALLVPTPGQTEQEYLAEHLHSKGIFPFMTQKEFNLEEAIHILDIFDSKQTLSSKDYLASELVKLF